MVLKKTISKTDYEEYAVETFDDVKEIVVNKLGIWCYSAWCKVYIPGYEFIYFVAFKNKGFEKDWADKISSMAKYEEVEKCLKQRV